jgi:DNA primase
MSRITKQKSVSKLIDIINKLIVRQEKMLEHIEELEDYCQALEDMSEIEEGEDIISFIPDEDFQNVIDESLSDNQKSRLEEIKNKKNKEEQKLFSIDEILKELEPDD